MKKIFSKICSILGGVLGICFFAVVLFHSFKDTFIYDVTKDVERKSEELRDKEEQEYQKSTVYVDTKTGYYHCDEHCKGVNVFSIDEEPLYKAEREGYKQCEFCW